MNQDKCLPEKKKSILIVKFFKDNNLDETQDTELK